MMEKWLPASMRSSDNPFYELLMLEAEDMLQQYIDSKIRPMKDIWSISSAPLDDLMSIAHDIFLIDQNVLEGAYSFLRSQASGEILNQPSEILKIASVFFQIELTSFIREIDDGDYRYNEEGVYLTAPTAVDFTDWRNVERFRSMVEQYCPGIRTSIEEDVFYFIYPVGSTPEMKDQYRQSLINTLCDWAATEEDGFSSMLAVDPVASGWIETPVQETYGFKIGLVQKDVETASYLGEALKFHIKNTSWSIDSSGKYIYLQCDTADDIALRKFRNEIAKIPYSIAIRGTKDFYISVITTFGNVYPGILSLFKTEFNTRVGRLIDNIILADHGTEGSETAFVRIPVSENFLAQEIMTNVLDDNIGTEENPEYARLDEDTLFNNLDMISASEETLYKKDFILGIQLDRNLFTGSSVWPQEISKFMQELIALNQKATDVVHLTPIISIDIDKDQESTPLYLPSSNSFVQVRSSQYRYADYYGQYDGVCIRMEAYEWNPANADFVKFYDYYLDPATDMLWNSSFAQNDCCLTMKASVQGKKWRLSRLGVVVDSAKKMTIDTGSSECMTQDIVLKIFEKGREDTSFYLFRQNRSGNFIQCAGPTDASGAFIYDVRISTSGSEIYLESDQDFASTSTEYEANFVSDKIEGTSLTKVSFILEYDLAGETVSMELCTLDFKNTSGDRLTVDLPSGVTLMNLISRHEKEFDT